MEANNGQSVDEKMYDSMMAIIRDAVTDAQQKINRQFGVKTEIEVKWKTTKRIGSMKLSRNSPEKEFIGSILVRRVE